MRRSTALTRSVRLIACTVTLGLLSWGCGGGGSSPTEPEFSSLDTPDAVENLLFEFINDARNASNDGTLMMDPLAREVARDFSAQMRDQGFFSHRSPNGDNLADRLRKAGVSFRKAAENIGTVQGMDQPASALHSGFMNSEGHRANILGPEWQLAGVGVAQSDDTYWATEIFILP